jgi:hypothetical protein
MTLPVLVWEKWQLPISAEVKNELTHKEKVLLFKADFFDMNADINLEKRDQLLLVVDTVLAHLAAQSPGLQWLAARLPRAHDHPHREAAKMKSDVHIECTINLSEMETENMCAIVEKILWRYLSLLTERLEGPEREDYSAALLAMRREGVQKAELRAAEAVVDAVVLRFGRLILWGDQLTVKATHQAIRARKDDWTKFERLTDWILIVLLGDLHIQMSLIGKNAKALMPEMTSRNPGTFGRFVTDLKRATKIFNDEKKLKKCGYFEENSAFHVAVGGGYLLEGLERYHAELAVRGEPAEDSVAGARQFLAGFRTWAKLQLWWDPAQPEPEFYDDQEEYAASVAVRTLHVMSLKHAVKYGDATAMRALHTILALLFQFSSTNMNSQYGPSLMAECIDYAGLSSTDQMRVDCMAVINSTGTEGQCIAVDCKCEHCVRDAKGLIDRFVFTIMIIIVTIDMRIIIIVIIVRFASTLEPGQLDTTMRANNEVVKLKDAMLDNTLHGNKKSGGGTSFEYFREEEKSLVLREVRKAGGLGSAHGREKVKIDFRVRGPWKGLTREKVEGVVDQKSVIYHYERVQLRQV